VCHARAEPLLSSWPLERRAEEARIGQACLPTRTIAPAGCDDIQP
jgi:hypothetical protein